MQCNSIEITQLQQCLLLTLLSNFRIVFQKITSGRLSLTPSKGDTVTATKRRYSRQRKKLNFSIEFSNSVLTHFLSSRLALNLHSKKISSKFFCYFELFICPTDVKRLDFFRDFLNLQQDPSMNPLWSLQHLDTPTSIL